MRDKSIKIGCRASGQKHNERSFSLNDLVLITTDKSPELKTLRLYVLRDQFELNFLSILIDCSEKEYNIVSRVWSGFSNKPEISYCKSHKYYTKACNFSCSSSSKWAKLE